MKRINKELTFKSLLEGELALIDIESHETYDKNEIYSFADIESFIKKRNEIDTSNDTTNSLVAMNGDIHD